mmetsp:Transcript_16014/g.50208  ORF Transcript_16014/g.50208 Transcript_16014/m.50208 type:complete len:298 (+) Transcript_16014:223-1116(+)
MSPTKHGELAGLVAVWYLSSCVAITTSKVCMQMARVPLVLCTTQFLTATAVTRCYLWLARSATRLRQAELGAVAMTAAAYSSGFATTNLAFSLAPAAFVETIKAGEPVSTAALAAVVLRERETVPTYLSLAPIVLGIALATGGSGEVFSLAAVVVVAANVCFSLRAVFVKRLKRRHPTATSASAVVLFYHVSRFGAPCFLLAAFSGFSHLLLSARVDPFRFSLAIVANGLAYSTYNLASFVVLNRVSTTTHAVLNVFRRVVVIAIASLYFRTPLTLSSVIGIALAAAGVFVYARSKE